MFDYRCVCGAGPEEHLVPSHDSEVHCDACGRRMDKVPVSRVAIHNGSGVASAERASWEDYSPEDLGSSARFAESAAYDVARKSGLSRSKARAAAKEAAPGMLDAGARLIRNQERAGQR